MSRKSVAYFSASGVTAVEEVGAEVTNVKPGDRVTVNVETFCG